jgi:hypothetical protein
MPPNYEAFLTQQNDRLKFYNQDFWETAKFFSAIALLLLSGPVPVWLKEPRPSHWSVVASAAPLLAVGVSYVAFKILKRTAETYYEVGASVVVLEGLLKLHALEHAESNRKVQLVADRRVDQARKSPDQLAGDFKGRLGFFSSSRMSWILKLFDAYIVVGLAEAVTLLGHGLWGWNLIDHFVRCFGK